MLVILAVVAAVPDIAALTEFFSEWNIKPQFRRHTMLNTRLCRSVVLATLFLGGLCQALAQDAKIVDKPITWDQERTDLTLEYRKLHQGGDPKDVQIVPKAIVLHWTGGTTKFEATWDHFQQNRIEGQRSLLAKNGALNVAAQFVVDRDGTIYRLMPETSFARHCIGLNQVAIGVENVGDGSKNKLTDAQIAADIALVRYLKNKYPKIEYLIGHHEYRRMESTPLWNETITDYRTKKWDPGDDFMTKVRAQLTDLNLKVPPPGPAAWEDIPSASK